jgi:hypothetical protein
MCDASGDIVVDSANLNFSQISPLSTAVFLPVPPQNRHPQDDDSVGELTERRPLYGSRAAQDDDSVGEPQEKQRQREAGL